MWKIGHLIMRLRKELLLAWQLLRNPATPIAAKIATIAALAYVIFPFDLIPDFIPLVGWIDDGLIAWLLLSLAFKLLPPELMAVLREKVNGGSPGPRRS